jgi:MMP 1-O-methyltransferase
VALARLARTLIRRKGANRTAAAEWPSDLREVPAIKGWLSRDAAVLLYELAREVTDGCIVEVGSYRGRSTVALARGAEAGNNPRVYAVEPHEPFVGALGGKFGPEDRAAFFRNMVRTGAYRQVRLLNVSSELVAPGWREPIALLWLDGDHSYEGVKRDFDAWEPHLLADCDVVLDDADDVTLGPHRLAEELRGAGWAEAGRAGRVLHLRRNVAPPAPLGSFTGAA